jgi:hypothetical protein
MPPHISFLAAIKIKQSKMMPLTKEEEPRQRKARNPSKCGNDLCSLNHIWGTDRLSDNHTPQN